MYFFPLIMSSSFYLFPFFYYIPYKFQGTLSSGFPPVKYWTLTLGRILFPYHMRYILLLLLQIIRKDLWPTYWTHEYPVTWLILICLPASESSFWNLKLIFVFVFFFLLIFLVWYWYLYRGLLMESFQRNMCMDSFIFPAIPLKNTHTRKNDGKIILIVKKKHKPFCTEGKCNYIGK